jgi:predicted AAA+ superfamily ATPase
MYNLSMDRNLYDELLKWKKSPTRKPLILDGARQVGKTFLIKEMFAKKEYHDFAYINFMNAKDKYLSSIFSDTSN